VRELSKPKGSPFIVSDRCRLRSRLSARSALRACENRHHQQNVDGIQLCHLLGDVSRSTVAQHSPSPTISPHAEIDYYLNYHRSQG
jgi:hypothetical protein